MYYDARLDFDDGSTVYLGYKYKTLFDVTPMCDASVNLTTNQTAVGYSEEVTNITTPGAYRTIKGKIIDEDVTYVKKLFSIAAGDSGYIYLISGNTQVWQRFTVSRMPEINMASKPAVFTLQLYSPTPYWNKGKPIKSGGSLENAVMSAYGYGKFGSGIYATSWTGRKYVEPEFALYVNSSASGSSFTVNGRKITFTGSGGINIYRRKGVLYVSNGTVSGGNYTLPAVMTSISTSGITALTLMYNEITTGIYDGM